jgi:hypothetical protein
MPPGNCDYSTILIAAAQTMGQKMTVRLSEHNGRVSDSPLERDQLVRFRHSCTVSFRRRPPTSGPVGRFRSTARLRSYHTARDSNER